MKTMKNTLIYTIALVGVVLILSNGCKKKDHNSDSQTPVFTVTADSVMLQAGGEGLQFFGKCTNEDVKVTKVMGTSPITVETFTYMMDGSTIDKNTPFSMQDENTAYEKELGTWNFTFEGTQPGDNSDFSVNASLTITVK
jgi:hypothetical protein